MSTRLESLINNEVNGNLTTAKRQARKSSRPQTAQGARDHPMKIKKPKSVTALAEAFVWKFGSAPKSREWEFMVHAFRKGYAAAKRRLDRSNIRSQPHAEDIAKERGELFRAGESMAAELCQWCPHEMRGEVLRAWDAAAEPIRQMKRDLSSQNK